MSAHEFIKKGRNGFVIPTDNPAALARRMSWFIQNASRIPQMGRAARQSLVDYRPEIGAERLVRCAYRLADQQDLPSDDDLSSTRGFPSTWKELTPASFANRIPSSGRALAKSIAIRASLALTPRCQPSGHRILAYHLVLKEDKQRFRDQLKYLADHFELCYLVDLIQGLNDQSPDSRPRLAITFDDGFRVLMQDCLNLLEELRIRASFFVSTGFIELCRQPRRYTRFSMRAHPHFNTPLAPMRPEDLQTLVALGHDVGSHGISHTSLRRMSSDMAQMELEISRQQILEWTGTTPRGFAFPYGHTTSSVLNPAARLRSAGYEFGLTLRRGKAEISNDPMYLPREHCEGNWSIQHLRYFLLS
jgi:peptidoglycan/xylan/chitin deacetylase (PgdA/CDA1 family)